MPDASPLATWEDSRRRAVRRVLGGVAALIGVIALGMSGYMALGWSAADALYMVVITVSGVGYTEVRQVATPWLRMHTMLVIVSGVVATAYTLANILRLVTEEELQHLLGHQRVRRNIENLKDHTIVVGFGRMGNLVCTELAASGAPFVLIEQTHERIPEIERRGWLFVVGDATEEKTLQDAGLERAKALVAAIPSDAVNLFITLTARQMAPKVQIVARAELPSTQKKLLQAGANHVVLPAAIGAHRIVSLLTKPSAAEFAELVTRQGSLAIEIDEVEVASGGPFAGKTLRQADIGRKTGVMVIAVKRINGQVDFPPSADESLAVGDSIVLLGRMPNLVQFRQEYCGEGRDGQ